MAHAHAGIKDVKQGVEMALPRRSAANLDLPLALIPIVDGLGPASLRQRPTDLERNCSASHGLAAHRSGIAIL
jgi:hypothetical protein